VVSGHPTSSLPNGLDVVIDFVNTLDREEHAEGLSSPAQLHAWLTARGLLEEDEAVDEQDLAAALELREALRSTMLANNGGDADPGAWSRVQLAAREGQLGVHFGAGGEVELAPSRRGTHGALASLLAPVASAIADGTWTRAKACRADACEWAFYDASRNRSSVWCAMRVCGNRAKVRAYRERAQ
jgi:predicted RNA-binding Zn ribbon-like protein